MPETPTPDEETINLTRYWDAERDSAYLNQLFRPVPSADLVERLTAERDEARNHLSTIRDHIFIGDEGMLLRDLETLDALLTRWAAT